MTALLKKVTALLKYLDLQISDISTHAVLARPILQKDSLKPLGPFPSSCHASHSIAIGDDRGSPVVSYIWPYAYGTIFYTVRVWYDIRIWYRTVLPLKPGTIQFYLDYNHPYINTTYSVL